jgi:hypothetical protein
MRHPNFDRVNKPASAPGDLPDHNQLPKNSTPGMPANGVHKVVNCKTDSGISRVLAFWSQHSGPEEPLRNTAIKRTLLIISELRD